MPSAKQTKTARGSSLPLDEPIPMSSDGLARIFQLIASGKILRVNDNRGHYYRVSAEEITKEEFEHEQKNERSHAADSADEAGRGEQCEKS